jgi:hypothetical protein
LRARILLLLCALSLTGCNAIYGEPNEVDWPSPPSSFPTTFLRGRVLEVGVIVPIAGATVTRGEEQVTSDSEGYYNLLSGISASQAQLTVTKEGYDTLRVSLILNGGDQVYNPRLPKK